MAAQREDVAAAAGARELTPAQLYNVNESTRSYLIPAASPAQQANDIALMLAELAEGSGLSFSPSELYDVLDEANRERLRPVMSLLTERRLDLGRERARREDAEEARAAARSRERRHARLLQPIRWAHSDRATLSEYLRLRERAKVHGVQSLTAEELERCRRYVEHHNRLAREARHAQRIYASLSKAQQRQFGGWRPSEFLAFRQSRPQRVAASARRIGGVRSAPRRARAPASPSESDSPEPPLGGIWAYLPRASARMAAHEARREARWRKGVAA